MEEKRRNGSRERRNGWEKEDNIQNLIASFTF